MEEADRTARSMGLSRSRLFSLALEDYLRRQRQEQMMAQLNEVYSDHPDPTEARIVRGIKKTVQRTIKDRWLSEVRQGDVYWFDFGRAAGSGPSDSHPCVVIQSDVFNRTRIATTVVCVITSNVNRAKAPGYVPLE